MYLYLRLTRTRFRPRRPYRPHPHHFGAEHVPLVEPAEISIARRRPVIVGTLYLRWFMVFAANGSGTRRGREAHAHFHFQSLFAFFSPINATAIAWSTELLPVPFSPSKTFQLVARLVEESSSI